jgi:hypothetical protein
MSSETFTKYACLAILVACMAYTSYVWVNIDVIEFEPIINLQPAEVGSQVKFDWLIHNKGRNPVVITSMQASCSCVKYLGSEQELIGAGASKVFPFAVFLGDQIGERNDVTLVAKTNSIRYPSLSVRMSVVSKADVSVTPLSHLILPYLNNEEKLGVGSGNSVSFTVRVSDGLPGIKKIEAQFEPTLFQSESVLDGPKKAIIKFFCRREIIGEIDIPIMLTIYFMDGAVIERNVSVSGRLDGGLKEVRPILLRAPDMAGSCDVPTTFNESKILKFGAGRDLKIDLTQGKLYYERAPLGSRKKTGPMDVGSLFLVRNETEPVLSIPVYLK